MLSTCTKSIFTTSSTFTISHHLVPTFYYLPTLSAKIGSVPFFSPSGKHQSHHLAGYYAIGINCLLISFLNALCCSNLLCQAKNLT